MARTASAGAPFDDGSWTPVSARAATARAPVHPDATSAVVVAIENTTRAVRVIPRHRWPKPYIRHPRKAILSELLLAERAFSLLRVRRNEPRHLAAGRELVGVTVGCLGRIPCP